MSVWRGMPHSPTLSLALHAAWKIALLIGFFVVAMRAGDWVMDQINPVLTPSTEPALHRLIMAAIGIYMLLMMLPFIPGAEIGLGLMATFGSAIAPLVYAATIVALAGSFLLGRLVPEKTIIAIFEAIRLKRAAALLRQLSPLTTDERLRFLLDSYSSSRVVGYLVRYRFLAIILALNLPGNAVIGGGGGICMVAGFCRMFSFGQFLIAMSLAVLPVPLAIFMSG